ncbi:MAG: class I SAM-dependent methyltransferase [Bacteroidales bacterium]|nr:class I SAM-dependent methyltransferase [Bacteroidales bacterium]
MFSDLAATEKWDIALFFRSFDEMPEIEQIALSRCEGRVLDAGAGAGSHALHLQNSGKTVTAIDISEGAVEVMQKRGVNDARLVDFFTLKEEKFDTLLLLMNGVGIVERMENFTRFFVQAKSLLHPGGKIILDSSNIIYMFADDDGSALIDLNSNYYGEMTYRMDFANYKGIPFDWIYIDFDTLTTLAEQHGFSCTKIYEDDHFHYLAELILKA